MDRITESDIENLTNELMEFPGCRYIYGLDIAPDDDTGESRYLPPKIEKIKKLNSDR